jgi:bacillopeptidase F
MVSLAVGRGGKEVPPGVAPGARWVVALGLREAKINNLDAVLCADWLLLRGRPDVLLCAWKISEAGECDRSFDRIVSAWKAAEIFVVFAAGNQGPGPGTGESPANAVGLYPGDAVAFSVGGTIQGGGRLPETAEGPNVCDPSRIFPRVSAPGKDLPGADASGEDVYILQRGTSFSASLVGGVAALLIQSNPDLAVSEIESILVETVADLGEPGPDPVFGHGLVQVPEAIEAARRRRSEGVPGGN